MSGANRYDKHARPGKHDSHRKHTKHTTYRYPDGATRPSASSSASHSREEPVRQSGTDGATQKSQPGFGSNTAEDVVFNNVVNDVGGVREMILDLAVIAFPKIADEYRARFRDVPITEAFRVSVVPVYQYVHGSLGRVENFALMAFLAYRKEGNVQHTELATGVKVNDIGIALHSLLEVLGDFITEGQEAGGLLEDMPGGEVFKSKVNLYSACVDSKAGDRGRAWNGLGKER